MSVVPPQRPGTPSYHDRKAHPLQPTHHRRTTNNTARCRPAAGHRDHRLCPAFQQALSLHPRPEEGLHRYHRSRYGRGSLARQRARRRRGRRGPSQGRPGRSHAPIWQVSLVGQISRCLAKACYAPFHCLSYTTSDTHNVFLLPLSYVSIAWAGVSCTVRHNTTSISQFISSVSPGMETGNCFILMRSRLARLPEWFEKHQYDTQGPLGRVVHRRHQCK